MNRTRAILVHLAEPAGSGASPYIRTTSFPSMGLLYLAAALRRAAIEPVYLDAFLEPLTPGRIADAAAGAVFAGFTSNIVMRPDVCAAIRELKRRADVPVIVGGPGHWEARDYLDAGADAVVAGEADEVIVPIARRLLDAAAAPSPRPRRRSGTSPRSRTPHTTSPRRRATATRSGSRRGTPRA